MQSIAISRTIAATPAQVWALISDVTTVVRYHPAVASADLLSDSPVGLHAARRCNFYDGTSVREEIVEVEQGRRVRLRVSEFTVPMHNLEAEFTVTPTSDGKAEMSFGIHYRVKLGLVGKLLGATVIRRKLRKVVGQVLAGVDHHLTTGQDVGQGFVARAA